MKKSSNKAPAMRQQAGDLEARISRIDWESLECRANRGAAIPKILRQLRAKPTAQAEENLHDLLFSLYQQETFYPDLAPVLPAMLGLLQESEARVRKQLLLFLTELLVGFSRRVDWPLLYPDLPSRQNKLEAAGRGGEDLRELEPGARATLEALDADASLLLQVAQSDSGSERLLAAQVAAYLPSSGSAGLELFARQTQHTRDPIEKASWCTALGVLSVVTGNHEQLGQIDKLLRSRDPLVKGCAAVCRALMATTAVEESVWKALGKLLEADRISAEKFPWMNGTPAGLAAATLGRLGRRDRDRAARLLLAAFSTRFNERDNREYSLQTLLGEPLTSLVFAPLWDRYDPPLLEELDPLQRKVLRTMACEHKYLATGLFYVGLELAGKNALRFLGEAKQGALDLRVTIDINKERCNWPVWKLWHLCDDGLLDFSCVVQAMEQLTPDDIWKVCLDLNTGGYHRGVSRHAPTQHRFANRLAERFAKELLPHVEDYAKRLIKRSKQPNRAELTLAMTPLLLGWKAHKMPTNHSVLKPLVTHYLKCFSERAKALHKVLPKESKSLVPKKLLSLPPLPKGLRHHARL